MITRRLQYELAGRAIGPMMMALDNWNARRRRRGRKPRDNPFGPPLESATKLKEIMSLHYFQGRYADGAVPVAWVTSGFPVEVLRPLGFHVVYPENHGALCGARRMGTELSEVAERDGYSQDLCGYARADIGSILSGKSPAGRLPKPDLLACCTNICQTVMYWYRSLADHFDVPLVLVDTPYVYGEPEAHHIDYVREQLEELQSVAEKISGRRTEVGELEQATGLAKEGTDLWKRCLRTSKAKPAPWSAFDGFIHMAPIVAMRGTEECNAYYRMLADELESRAKAGIGGLKEERHRLLWDNLPIWYKIRDLSTTFAEQGFNFVCATYTNAWAETGDLYDPADPIGSGAVVYSNVLLNRDLPNRLRVIKGLAEEFDVDGVVLHSDRSCKPYSIGQIDLKQKVAEESGLKAVILEADHTDERAYSEEQLSTRLQAFIESFA